jgi:hypothetical protein
MYHLSDRDSSDDNISPSPCYLACVTSIGSLQPRRFLCCEQHSGF